MQIEVLSAYDYDTKKSYGTKKRYQEIMKQYPSNVRGDAANYAAHSWDILLVDGQLMAGCYCTMWRDGLHGPYGYIYDKDGTITRIDKGHPTLDALYPREAKTRSFSLEKKQ